MNRKDTNKIRVGNKYIGGSNEILIQSMTTYKTSDIENVVKQILELEKIGLDIIRVSVLDIEDASAIKEIKKQIHVPLVADIHFDSNLAKLSIINGADKIRINPGNFPENDLEEIIMLAKRYDIAIRIGVNYGSLEKDLYYLPPYIALYTSVSNWIDKFEKLGFFNIVVSAKSSDVEETLKANEMIANNIKYPLHIGVTEAGDEMSSLIKSSYCLATLINKGIGSTIRVSINTDDLTKEVISAREILKMCNINNNIPTIIACPTCGRCMIDTVSIVKELRKHLYSINKDITIAIMGCVVNGPGEARNADIGIAGGKDSAMLFKKGEIIRKIPYNSLIDELLEEINKL